MHQITTVQQDLDRRAALRDRAARSRAIAFIAPFAPFAPFALVLVLIACILAASYGDMLSGINPNPAAIAAQ